MKRVYVDNTRVLLCQNTYGIVYKTTIMDIFDYPPKTMLHVFEGRDSSPLKENWENKYKALFLDRLSHYTWQGRPILRDKTYTVARIIAMLGEEEYGIHTPTYMPPITSTFVNLKMCIGGRFPFP